MSFSFFTTPTDDHPPEPPGRRLQAPSRGRTIVTYGLMGIWLFLIIFGTVAMINPPWLQRISDPGMITEFKDNKHFADDLYRQGNYTQAIAQYQNALKIIPDDVGALTNLGSSWIKIGYKRDGIRILKEALEKAVDDTSRGIILTNLAEVYEKQKDFDTAIEYARQAVECGSELNVRYGKLGTLYLAKEDWPRAREAFTHSQEHQLDITRSYRDMLQRALDSFREEDSNIAVVEELLEKEYTEADLIRYDLDTIRRIQTEDRTVAITHNYLGWTFICEERFDEAAAHFEESLRIWPSERNQNAHKNLAIIEQIRADEAAFQSQEEGGK